MVPEKSIAEYAQVFALKADNIVVVEKGDRSSLEIANQSYVEPGDGLAVSIIDRIHAPLLTQLVFR